MSSFKAGICQTPVFSNKQKNLEAAGAMISEAAARGCKLVVLPEMFNCPYVSEAFPRFAEPVPGGETFEFLRNAAAREEVYLIGGSIPERTENGHVFNTSLIFSPSGQLLGMHRKMHLFDVDIKGGLQFRESDTLKPGQKITLFHTELADMGLGICYDLRFPEYSRLLALKGAQVLIFPAAFSTTTGPPHWEILLRSRAVDNQVFVLAASPARHPESLYPAYGHSMAVDPWGTVLVEAGEGPELVVAELDLNRLYQVREELPLLKHRRHDRYLVCEI